jgi:hypothetical protein
MSKIIEGRRLMAGDWDSFDDEVDKLVSDEVQQCARLSWRLMSVYFYPHLLSELDGIMKCAYRLIKLFLSDDIDEIYKFGSELDQLYLSLSALKISWIILAQNKIEDFTLDNFLLDKISDSNYQWIAYDSSARKKMLTYEFQLMKYPYNRCFSYMRYDLISKEEFNEILKRLFAKQTGTDNPGFIDEHFQKACYDLSCDRRRIEEYMKSRPDGIEDDQYSIFDMPKLVKMGEK